MFPGTQFEMKLFSSMFLDLEKSIADTTHSWETGLVCSMII